jgi:hypothetical protein
MKKVLQFLVVIALVLTVVGIAKYNTAWASQSDAAKSGAQPVAGVNLIPPMKITITGSGLYNVGGICTLDVGYKVDGLQDMADAEVPLSESSKVPFTGLEKLVAPGCHIVHYKAGQIVREASSTDGNWKVCFGANPNLKMRIYYYLDTPASGKQVWTPIDSTVENGYVCAPALFTGVYMPAGKLADNPGQGPGGHDLFPGGAGGGSVVPPPSDITVTESGTYAVGGICAIIIKYNINGLSDNIHVQLPTVDTNTVPFPDNQGMLYLPGCHVLHYENSQIKPEMTPAQGSWKICFASRPSKIMTIFFYRDDLTNITPPWVALETTVENGLACAPLADYSGVYAPSGK